MDIPSCIESLPAWGYPISSYLPYSEFVSFGFETSLSLTGSAGLNVVDLIEAGY